MHSKKALMNMGIISNDKFAFYFFCPFSHNCTLEITEEVDDKQPDQYRIHSLYFRLMNMNVKQWPLYPHYHTTRFYNYFIIVCSQRTQSLSSISQVRPSYLALLFHFSNSSIIAPCHKSHGRVYPLLPHKTQISIHLST